MEGKEICNNKCCSCGACQSVCPKLAISMVENGRGFLEPHVDKNLCVDCGVCSLVCNSKVKRNSIEEAFIVKIKDCRQHLNSQSGGAFTAISDTVLAKNGTVYGVTMDSNYEGVYAGAKTPVERDEMHGSKYMRARVGDAYKEVEAELKHGPVLFSGTPCHVAGLLKYLQKRNVDTTYLYTVDLICHGTPSVRVWRSMLKHISRDAGPVLHAICRDKLQTGWGGSSSTFYANKKVSSNIFCKIFFTDLCLGESCYSCEYASKERVGDISIGDAWGVQKHNPEFYDSRGVSFLLVNSSKGKELFEHLQDKVVFQKVDLNLYAQKNLSEPSYPHRNIDEFWCDFDNRDFEYIIKKYGKNDIFLNYKYVIKKVVSKIWKRR